MSAVSGISVLLPVYNQAHFINRALDALLAQQVPPLEIIIIDDASTDGSATAAEGLRKKLEPTTSLRILRNSLNLGVNHSLNRGLQEACGVYVACTAADDWLEPSFVATMAASINRYPEARLITSRYVEYFEGEDRTVEHDSESEMGLWFARDGELFFDPNSVRSLLHRGYVALPVSASVIHTATLRELGGFDPLLKWHADWFASTAISLRHGFAIAPEPLAVFRIANGTYSGDNVRNSERQHEVCAAICDKLGTTEFADIRSKLCDSPSPFAPFARYMIPTLACRPNDWDLLWKTSLWWLREAARGRRPGTWRTLAKKMGVYRAPR